MVEAGQDWKDVAIPAAGGGSGAAPVAAPAASPSPPSAITTTATAHAEHDFTHPAMTGPATALLLSQYNIQPASIAGSGPKGNILKSDVLRYIAANNLSPVVSAVPPPAAKKAAVASPPINWRPRPHVRGPAMWTLS
jgi:pyruvate/2-oxoglutarate dehydrogenase complex dihydrolipoamide acyltransferase (E2) component